MLVQPAPTTLARWEDRERIEASSRAVTVSRPDLKCTGGVAVSQDITWKAAASHASGVSAYSARVVRLTSVPLTISRDGDIYKVTVTSALLSLGQVKVEVTALPGSPWEAKSTLTLGQSVISLVTVGLACPTP